MRVFFVAAFVSLSGSLMAQEARPVGGGDTSPKGKAECVSPAQRIAIARMLDSNRRDLIDKGLLPDPSKQEGKAKKTTAVMFDWPLNQVKGNYFSVYGISNYIDEDPTYPGHIQDWNCGTRTYDLSSGYNHAGTDIYLTPFSWNIMEDEHVEIIAAAPGTIIGKTDGNFDHNCAMGTDTWNSVYIQHSDGTVAWYGHMKTGTPTAKSIGATVALGEHLGYVGSSGSSTGPHLHFEVHDASGDVRDPWTGPCNALPSLWNTQKPYYESEVNALMTHFAPPGFADCPMRDTINAEDTFAPGSKVYTAVYYHDEQVNDTSFFRIKRPDGTTYSKWTHTSTASYSSSYWYWSHTIPATEQMGRWHFQDSFKSVINNHDFYILDASLKTRSVVAGHNDAVIYPNPATDHVEIMNAIGGQLRLYDMAGRMLRSVRIDADKTPLDTRDLAPGVYVARLDFDDGDRQNIRMVKE